MRPVTAQIKATFNFQFDIQCSWMSESPIDWIYQGPTCGVLIINLIFLLRIMWVRIIKNAIPYSYNSQINGFR